MSLVTTALYHKIMRTSWVCDLPYDRECERAYHGDKNPTGFRTPKILLGEFGNLRVYVEWKQQNAASHPYRVNRYVQNYDLWYNICIEDWVLDKYVYSTGLINWFSTGDYIPTKEANLIMHYLQHAQALNTRELYNYSPAVQKTRIEPYMYSHKDTHVMYMGAIKPIGFNHYIAATPQDLWLDYTKKPRHSMIFFWKCSFTEYREKLRHAQTNNLILYGKEYVNKIICKK